MCGSTPQHKQRLARDATGVQLESKQLTSRATLSLRSLLREFHEAGAYSEFEYFTCCPA